LPALSYQISPREAKTKVAAGEAALIDVRELKEHATSRIEGAELIPMNTVPARLPYLDGLADEKLLIVYCHHGMRSLNVVSWLRKQGVENCQSMAGGIEQWSAEVDPTVPRY
jgi:rhodanese-related sulfurtransferase